MSQEFEVNVVDQELETGPVITKNGGGLYLDGPKVQVMLLMVNSILEERAKTFPNIHDTNADYLGAHIREWQRLFSLAADVAKAEAVKHNVG